MTEPGTSRIDSVLVTVPYGERHRERLRNLFSPADIIECDRRDDQGIRRALRDADVAVIAGDVDGRFLEAPKLKWVHCEQAGIERSARPEVFELGLLVTGAAGRSAPALAEHVLYFMLGLAYRSADFHEAARAQRWGIEGQQRLRALRGATVGLIGMGHTATALLPVLDALGMETLVYRRMAEKPPYVARLYAQGRGDTPAELLRASDFVVLACSLNNSTRNLVDATSLASMKRSAFLINVARGGLVDETALVEALRTGRIAGAGLDTFSVEPLPVGHPLWSAPNVLITPHVTPPLRDRTDRSLDILADNVERFRAGHPLLNLLTPADLFTP